MSEQNQQQIQQSQQIAPENKGAVVYQVAGQDVKLSYQIVRNFLTKGNGQVSDQDLTQFISICKYNQLNPFLNEAYLVKFGTTPAQMIVSKEALMKRAENCANYEGFKAGIIVIRDKVPVDVEGCFLLPTDELVGGWAEVHRSDRKFPVMSRVTLSEYDKKQSIWSDKRSTMIRKVAIVQALREAFPTQLGAMYTAEEQRIVENADYIDVSERKNNSEVIQQDEPEQTEQADNNVPRL
ncbi:MAG: phage recombination protein Bet [Prevotella sp.]|jgi:phage recombination protein Bet|nr:phage recombination protein Bet [Prevotella sp.]